MSSSLLGVVVPIADRRPMCYTCSITTVRFICVTVVALLFAGMCMTRWISTLNSRLSKCVVVLWPSQPLDMNVSRVTCVSLLVLRRWSLAMCRRRCRYRLKPSSGSCIDRRDVFGKRCRLLSADYRVSGLRYRLFGTVLGLLSRKRSR